MPVQDLTPQLRTRLSRVERAVGVFVILAANLVTSRDERAGTLEMLAAAPVAVASRTRALVLAALGPALC